MRSRRIALTFVTLAVLGSTTGGAAEERLRIDVYPRFTGAPAAVRVRATVARDDKNRALVIVADSGNYYRSSLIHLDGADAATVNEMMLKNMPAGRYAVTVVLTDTDGRETSKSSEVLVTGNF
jgi:hypothetical protein